VIQERRPESLVEVADVEQRARYDRSRLRYCPVSQPWYIGRDMPVDDFDNLVSDLKARNVERFVINGHGETTMLPKGGEVRKIADACVSMAIISNFARLMSEDELEAMALKSNIQISIDTHRPDLLRKLRRKVDVRNISGIFLELRHNRQERP
jgi:hypothetical protein